MNLNAIKVNNSSVIGVDDNPKNESENLIKSGGTFVEIERKLDTNSVNLYNSDEFLEGKYLSDTGYINNQASTAVSNFIPINKQNVTLRLFFNLYNGLCVYDKNKKFIRSITSSTWTYLYTYHYQEGEEYLRATVGNTVIRMANYGDTIKDWVPYNPISNYLPQLPLPFSLTDSEYINQRVRELYINNIDTSKYYYVYSLQYFSDSSPYQFYVGVSDTENIGDSPTIVAFYDSSVKPVGVVKLLGSLGGYAVLDFYNIENDVYFQKIGRKHILNKDIISNLDYNPSIKNSQYLGYNGDVRTSADYSIELFAEHSIINKYGNIGQSKYTNPFNVYKLSGDAITKKKDIIFRNYIIEGQTVNYVTAWDIDDNYLGTFAEVYNDETPLRVNHTYDFIAKTSQYENINYILFVISNNNWPSIDTKIYSNLSFLPAQKTNTILVASSGGDYTKLIDAIEYANAHHGTIININPGTYDLINEFGDDYFSNMTNTYYEGIKLGNNTTIRATGNNVNVVAQYTGDNVYVGYQFSIFNIIGTCTVEGINFIAQNTRYAIHDDIPIETYLVYNYIVTFKNCSFNHKGSTMYDSTQSLPVGVGGGCHYNSVHIFENCLFLDEANVAFNNIGYHNSAICNSKVIIKNSYFKNGKRFHSRRMGQNEGTIQCILSGNHFGLAPDITGEPIVTSVQYNNENAA